MREQATGTSLDETLAMGFYTGQAVWQPYLVVAPFSYTIRKKKSPLDRLASSFSNVAKHDVSPAHRALLESGETQSDEDIALAKRMQGVQCSTLEL